MCYGHDRFKQTVESENSGSVKEKKQYKQETALDEKNNHETILLTFGLSI